MTDGESGSFGGTRALAPVARGSLTRRVLAQKPQPPSMRERFLGFDWYRFFGRSFLLMVALPAAVTFLYLFLFASPTYVVETRLAVRAASDRPLIEAYIADSSAAAEPTTGKSAKDAKSRARTPDIMSTGTRATQIAALALGSLGGGVNNDSFMVADFIKSADMIAALDQDGWLRARLAAGDPDWVQAPPKNASIERLTRYWRNTVSAAVDVNTGLITVRITAFTPEDAAAISARAMGLAEALVNRMAERARRDRLSIADAEVARTEARYLAAEAAMRDLRGQDAIVDPAQQAQGSFKLLLDLISARIALDVQLRILAPTLSEDSPQIRSLRKRIAALDAEIAKAKAALTDQGGDASAASNYLAAFESAETERRLSAILYGGALDNLERARLEAERQASYLAVFVPPVAPLHAAGPHVLSGTLTVLVTAALIWGVVLLFVAASREHLS